MKAVFGVTALFLVLTTQQIAQAQTNSAVGKLLTYLSSQAQIGTVVDWSFTFEQTPRGTVLQDSPFVALAPSASTSQCADIQATITSFMRQNGEGTENVTVAKAVAVSIGRIPQKSTNTPQSALPDLSIPVWPHVLYHRPGGSMQRLYYFLDASASSSIAKDYSHRIVALLHSRGLSATADVAALSISSSVTQPAQTGELMTLVQSKLRPPTGNGIVADWQSTLYLRRSSVGFELAIQVPSENEPGVVAKAIKSIRSRLEAEGLDASNVVAYFNMVFTTREPISLPWYKLPIPFSTALKFGPQVRGNKISYGFLVPLSRPEVEELRSEILDSFRKLNVQVDE